MNKLDLEITYFDIIYSLVKPPFSVKSFTKLFYLSLAIKNVKNVKNLANRELNLLSELLRNISGIMLTPEDDMIAIFDVLEKLKKTSTIKIRENKIELLKDEKIQSTSNFINMVNSHKIIEEICQISDNSFVEEVLKYV